ncbi:restriction endonuclease subunit S [Brachyspira pilosicoli]|uniref:restriction endonuclease subunit S n=1 Tax=Brachyspira pilosicoli TaxID=52584 RepID=UPI001C6697D9|nr:restriction endonuclease subunit S [Brachyspira pilosicoli]MBW5383519.1 restriction endonuclease subunit S [Brachyspira pilosicoli]
MSTLKELLKKYCPDGVEWKNLGEVCNIITDYVAAGSFKDIAKNVEYVRSPDYAQLVRTTDIKNNFKNNGFVYVNKKAFDYLYRVNLDKESIILPNVGINCGEVYYVTPDLLPYKNNVLGPNAILVRSDSSNNKFLSYIFQLKLFQTQLRKIISTAGQPKFNKTEFKKIYIPVPPIEVQKEIVRILDTFTKYQDLLNRELELRKKQYEYYRGKLLTFGDEVELKSFGEVCDVVTDYVAAGSFKDIAKNVEYVRSPDYAQLVRTTDIKNNFKNDGFVYVNKKAFDYLYRVNLDKESIILPNVGINCGEVYYITPNMLPYKNNVLGPNAILVRSSNTNNKFLSYIFEEKLFQTELRRITSTAGQPKFNKTELKKIKIPIPPLKEQERIVKILDQFDTLCNDITRGLPAEIELRKKQYEYYRDKLVTFKEKKV